VAGGAAGFSESFIMREIEKSTQERIEEWVCALSHDPILFLQVLPSQNDREFIALSRSDRYSPAQSFNLLISG
jgi:hypothetical protein